MDLVIGLIVLCLLSAACFACGATVARRSPAWVSAAAAATVFSLTIAFAIGLHGRLTLVRILPLCNAILVGNWIPLGAAVLMGIVAGQPKIPRWRRIATTSMLAALAWYTVAYDLVAPAPRAGRPRFVKGFCMQTTPASCSACCAAALLMDHGIPASEAEMMQLCLTRMDGTPELGLYRGVKLKAQKAGWDVQFVPCQLDQLREPSHLPALLLVHSSPNEGTRLQPWWRRNRANHAVVVYGFTDSGRIEVGCPSSGRVRWSVEYLARTWHGGGLRLMRRTQKSHVDGVEHATGSGGILEDNARGAVLMTGPKPDSGETIKLLDRIRDGSPAFDELFARHRQTLQQVVALRFDPSLRARADPSDVVQEAQMEAYRRLPDYLDREPMPFHLWLRKMAQERLIMMRRRHLDASCRAVGQELSLSNRSSVLLAQQLLASGGSPSQLATQEELACRVRRAIGRLPERDREILLMRAYEGLSYDEICCLLELEPAAARKRYGRALLRLQGLLAQEGLSESQL